MKLYEIDAAILECIDMETGEILDMDKLTELNMERDAKFENVACWIKDLTAEAKALKEEKDKLAERQKAAENKADSLKKWLAYALDGQKFSTSKCAVSFRRSKSVVIEDEAAITPEWLIQQPPKIDKAGIKQALAAGVSVPGASMTENVSCIIK